MVVPEKKPQVSEIWRDQNKKDRHNFGALFEHLDAKAREQGIPLHGTFELTPLCNFRCKMCYVQLTREQMAGRKLISTERWKDLIHQAWEAGMIAATLTGGECLAYPGFEEIYLYLHSLGCQVDILTNGALLNDRWVRFFQEHIPVAIQITLYGGDEDAYERVTGQRAFGVVVENIRRIKEAGLPLVLTVTPNRYLGEGVFETIRTAKSLSDNVQVNTEIVTPREETGRSGQMDDLDVEFYARISRYIKELDGEEIVEVPENALPPIGGPSHEPCGCGLLCSAGRSGFTVDWKGNMSPCSSLEMIKARPLEEGFRAAWRKINRAVCEWPRVPECEDCAYYPACGVCAATMIRFAEPGVQPVALCEQIRYLVQHGARQIPGL